MGQTLLAAFIPDAKASEFSARKIIKKKVARTLEEVRTGSLTYINSGEEFAPNGALYGKKRVKTRTVQEKYKRFGLLSRVYYNIVE